MKDLIKGAGIALAILVAGYLIFAFIKHPPKNSGEWASWVQAAGAIIGIAVAIYVPYRQHETDQKRTDKQSRDELRALLMGLRDELSVITETFQNRQGMLLDAGPPGTPYLYKLPISERPFLYYESNVGKLGMIPNDALRRQVIVAYGRVRGISLSIQLNNTLVENFENADHMAVITNNDGYRARKEMIRAQLIDYADNMRSLYREAKRDVTALLDALNTEIATR